MEETSQEKLFEIDDDGGIISELATVMMLGFPLLWLVYLVGFDLVGIYYTVKQYQGGTFALIGMVVYIIYGIIKIISRIRTKNKKVVFYKDKIELTYNNTILKLSDISEVYFKYAIPNYGVLKSRGTPMSFIVALIAFSIVCLINPQFFLIVSILCLDIYCAVIGAYYLYNYFQNKKFTFSHPKIILLITNDNKFLALDVNETEVYKQVENYLKDNINIELTKTKTIIFVPKKQN